MRFEWLARLMLALVLAGGFPAAQAAAQGTGTEIVPPSSAPAAEAADEAGDLYEKTREKAAGVVRKSVDATAGALRGLKDGVKDATGLSDEQIYGIGVGLLAGVAAADILGTGGLGSVAVMGLGGMIGNWVATRGQDRR